MTGEKSLKVANNYNSYFRLGQNVASSQSTKPAGKGFSRSLLPIGLTNKIGHQPIYKHQFYSSLRAFLSS